MKNVTITLEDDVTHWAQARATERGTSLSLLISSLLHERMLEDDGYKAAMSEALSAKAVELKRSGPYPARDELHDRSDQR